VESTWDNLSAHSGAFVQLNRVGSLIRCEGYFRLVVLSACICERVKRKQGFRDEYKKFKARGLRLIFPVFAVFGMTAGIVG
jgi:hypothetical protein